MNVTGREASAETLRMYRWERVAYKLYTDVEKSQEKLDWPTDFAMAARLLWMEAGRALDRHCEADGIGRWNYRWPS